MTPASSFFFFDSIFRLPASARGLRLPSLHLLHTRLTRLTRLFDSTHSTDSFATKTRHRTVEPSETPTTTARASNGAPSKLQNFSRTNITGVRGRSQNKASQPRAKVKPGPGSFSCSRKYSTPLHSNFIQRANSRLQDASTSNSHPRRCSVLRYIVFECRCRHGIGTPTCYLQTHRHQQQFFYRLFLLRSLHSAFRTTQPNPWSIDEPQILAAANACIYRCFISSHEDRHVRLWS